MTAATWGLIPGAGLTGAVFASAGSVAISNFHIAATDYAVEGKTAKLNVKANLFTNSIAPGSDLTFGVLPVTSSTGGNDIVALTTGANPGGTAQFTDVGLSANGMFEATGADIDLPTDGFYLPVITTSASITANARVLFHLAVRIRHI